MSCYKICHGGLEGSKKEDDVTRDVVGGVSVSSGCMRYDPA